MKDIKSDDTHGGWSFASTSSGIRTAIKNALCSEFGVKQTNANSIELSPLRLLNAGVKTFVFRARIGPKVHVGVARVDVEILQPKVGEEYASTFVHVSYE